MEASPSAGRRAAPIDHPFVRARRQSREPVCPAVDALDLELLARLDAILFPQRAGQDDLALRGDDGLHASKRQILCLIAVHKVSHAVGAPASADRAFPSGLAGASLHRQAYPSTPGQAAALRAIDEASAHSTLARDRAARSGVQAVAIARGSAEITGSTARSRSFALSHATTFGSGSGQWRAKDVARAARVRTTSGDSVGDRAE